MMSEGNGNIAGGKSIRTPWASRADVCRGRVGGNGYGWGLWQSPGMKFGDPLKQLPSG